FPTLAALAAAAALPAVAGGVPDAAERQAGTASTWSHELNQNELPAWRKGRKRPLVPPGRWFRTIDGILRTSGENGLWFSGVSALPFPPLPLPAVEPTGWRNRARLARQFRRTGLKWDVNVEVWAARNALDNETAIVNNPRTEAHTRRLSLLDPGYRREALKEIRRIVPRHRNLPYVNFYTGSDEPIVFLPSGKRAVRTAYARRLRRDVQQRYGQRPPAWNAKRTRSPHEQLRWVAYSRYVSDRFFSMKREQAALIRRLDPDAVVNPNDFAFITGFMPWDYTKLSGFADVVEADPYVSFPERDRRGRGRYNPGFGAKFLHDLTGKRVRIVVQAFPHSRYNPRPADLWNWTAQALGGGATDISFFASQNPRFTNRRLYDTMLDVAGAMRGATLPAHPRDPEHLVLYSTASEGQAQPHRNGGDRYRTSGDELYSTYALLGALNGGAFQFEADTRLQREPQRLSSARTMWLPKADVLDRPMAEGLLAWVRGGGTLVVTDPEAFTRTPSGDSLGDVRSALIGAPLGGRRLGTILEVEGDALGAGLPADLLSVPVETTPSRAFAAVPSDATVVARFIDGAPAALSRPVGSGRVLAFASDVMSPAALDDPQDLVRFVRAVHTWAGGSLDHPAYRYRLPGDPIPRRLPVEDAVRSEEVGGTVPPPVPAPAGAG
ncbi:MAG: beta-galactosidase, partial [Miltoncostaeaceae bacterium]